MKNFDSYYDPPDEPEAQFCESCGQEMELRFPIHEHNAYFCDNPFCPERFRAKSIEQEMAEALVVAVDTVSRLKGKVAQLNRIIKIYDPEWKD